MLKFYNFLPKKEKSRELVISRFNEDVTWTNSYKRIRKIYNKGNVIDGINCIRLPNVGRESHTYLYHIINNWNNLADQTIFCQGNIDEHGINPEKIDLLFRKTGIFKTYSPFLCRQDNWGYIQHKGKWKIEKETGYMKAAKLSFGEWFDQAVQYPRNDFFVFVPGANFCVHKSAIKNRPLNYYKQLIKFVETHVNPEECHYFERAWLYIFGLSADQIKVYKNE